MKETPLSNCEKDFISKCISERMRLDRREAYDYRQVNIEFGLDTGCCKVELGETCCMAQVSCEVTAPKQTRPTDGILFTNVELSPMASPGFEPGRMSDFGVELNRLLERCLKESGCIDTESLCIVAGEKVWTVRVDVHVLNHEGNLLDCISIAAITALAHFRRPDVTVLGDEITVHPIEEKNPVALSVLHMPLTVTFAFFDQGRYVLVDPLQKEELVMDGQMVIGMNKHREICTLQMTGDMLLLKEQVLRCSNIAVVKVTEITEQIQKALREDASRRSEGKPVGFATSHDPVKITSLAKESEEVQIDDVEEKAIEIVQEGKKMTKNDGKNLQKSIVNKVSERTAKIGEGGPSTWGMDKDRDQELREESQVLQTKQTILPKIQHSSQDITMDDDSEEEPIILKNEDLYVKRSEIPTKSTSDVTEPPAKKKSTSGNKKKKKSKS